MTERVRPHPPMAVPPVGRPPWWLGVVFVVGYLPFVLDGEEGWLPRSWQLGLWAVVSVVVLVRAFDDRGYTIVTDGLSVEVRRGLSSTRFAIGQVEWVLTSPLAPGPRVRVRRPERRIGGLRLPNLVPWPTTVRAAISPWTWTHQLGVPEDRVGRSGLAWWRPKRA